jgi:hypothetical protein
MRELNEILDNHQFRLLRKIETDEVLRLEGYFFDPVTQKRYLVFFTVQYGWEHASCGTNTKTPSWDIMCRIKDIFWRKDECCVQYHPKEEDYVTMHEFTLHIWKQVDKEFPTPPVLMVGIPGVTPEEASLASQLFVSSLTDEQKFAYAASRGIKVGNRSMKRKAGMK